MTATAAAGPTVRALPTPFDPPSGPATVATPSCCCCCCCCLNALAAGVAFTTGAAAGVAATNRRPAVGPVLLALAALPVAVATVSGLSKLFLDLPGPVGVAAFVLVHVGVSALALRLAGAAWSRTWLVALLVPLAAAGLFAVEIFVALFTMFLVELLTPLTFIAALHLGRRAHQEPEATEVSPWPPYPPLPPAPYGTAPPAPAFPPTPPLPPSPETPELPWPSSDPPPAAGERRGEGGGG